MTALTALASALLMTSLPLMAAADDKPAAAKPATPEQRARFEREQARCSNGSSNQDRETCLREARNALADAQRGKLAVPGADMAANAQARCAPLPAGQREDCLKRVDGQGVATGSVRSGGILRETTTIVPAAAASAASQPPAAGTVPQPQPTR